MVHLILERLLEIPFLWGLALGSLIFVAYVALGGLLAVVWTNIAQFFFMWAGLLLIAPVLLQDQDIVFVPGTRMSKASHYFKQVSPALILVGLGATFGLF